MKTKRYIFVPFLALLLAGCEYNPEIIKHDQLSDTEQTTDTSQADEPEEEMTEEEIEQQKEELKRRTVVDRSPSFKTVRKGAASVLYDSDTGVQYIVLETDEGGVMMHPRLQKNGELYIHELDRDETSDPIFIHNQEGRVNDAN